ncbi:MAG TPA: hemolysin D [Flavobacteriaceae bacterium]|nr:hemolysin D [Flavobacteriaceae bacterium]
MRILKLNTYSINEERVNVISHGIGLLLSIIALFFLIYKSVKCGSDYHIFSAVVFGISLILLYTASTLYHNSTKEKLRKRLNVFDHASIFILIAGSYTPFLLISLRGTLGWHFFIFIWIVAFIGVVLKLFFFGKYSILSTIMYISMGWVIVFVMKTLINSLDINGVYWLFVGGILYTIGAIIYSINKIKMNHAIFHIFVLLGSISHFVSIYFYVLPNKI